MFSVRQDLNPVNEYVFHTGCVLMRLLECGMIGDRLRVEYHNVGKHSFLDKTSVIQFQIRRRQRGHPTHRVA